MTPDPPEVAQGFFRLGMWNVAWNELEEIPPERCHLPPVMLLQVLILNNLEKWESAAIIGEGALRHYPDFGALRPGGGPRGEEIPRASGSEKDPFGR